MSKYSIRENPPLSQEDVGNIELYDQCISKYKELYDDITSNGIVLKYHDRHALIDMAIITIQLNKARLSMNKDGYLMEVQGDKGMVFKKNPAVEMVTKLQSALMRMQDKFQMTPNARRNNVVDLGMENQKAEDNWNEV